MDLLIHPWWSFTLLWVNADKNIIFGRGRITLNIQELRTDIRHDRWFGYEPLDAQYFRYIQEKPSVLAVGHKIADVYHTFCDARSSLLSSNYKNYGDLCADNDYSRMYIKTKFLKQALLDYAICLDLSWQAIWAYVQPSSFAYLLNQNYKEMEQWCNSEGVHSQLNCLISQYSVGYNEVKNSEDIIKIKNLLGNFENNVTVKKVRGIYNSIKHRGTIEFRDFNEEGVRRFLFDKNIEMPLKREVYDLEQFQNMLLEYHDKFIEYFDEFIDIVMPKDYKNNSVEIIDGIIVLSEISELLAKKK